MTAEHAWVDLLRAQTDRFAAAIDRRDLEAPVAHCPGWTVRDLAVHLGGVHQWAAHAVVEGNPDLVPTAPDGESVAYWYGRHASRLIEVLSERPADTPAWTLDRDNPTAGFWRRRQVHETVMHTWDAEHAVGEAAAIDPALAWDGVLEVSDILYPRQLRLGRIAPLDRAVRLVATDVPDAVVRLGEGETVEVRHTAEVLLRLLWHRAAADEAAPDEIAVLAGAVTP